MIQSGGNMRATSVCSVVLLALAIVVNCAQSPAFAANAQLGIGNILGGAGQLAGVGDAMNAIPNMLGAATSAVDGLAKPVTGALSSLTQASPIGALVNGMGAQAIENPLTEGFRTAQGVLNGLTSGLAGSVGLGSLTQEGGLGGALSAAQGSAAQSGFESAAAMGRSFNGASPAFGPFKREALASGAALGAAASASQMQANLGAAAALAPMSPASLAHEGAQAAAGQMMGMDIAAADHAAAVASNGVVPAQMAAANHLEYANQDAAAMGAYQQLNVAANQEASAAARAAAAATAAQTGAASVPLAVAGATAEGGAPGANPVGFIASPGTPLGRQALAADALNNARAESARAGADMAAHGANNARSASLASNAFRQAKLASARDRVNVAGTIQNSARISDAAIATHDAATKAEDSLLGSELAVDSAATVLDSDAAYIPPVTSSLLRSLPYGRLGVRNILPKPLTYPSILLPDVWLNGMPVNYMNVPLRMLPYGIGSTPATNTLYASGAALANGPTINGQPFLANNGLLLNNLFFDPATAYLVGGPGGSAYLVGSGSSVFPVLANGQLAAQDEIATANMIAAQQLAGAGMSATYTGFGRSNPVPMLTGSVSDANLMPTTIIGTTYPIGSALVVEPRDSYFQDYVDNASSRQNFDERQQ